MRVYAETLLPADDQRLLRRIEHKLVKMSDDPISCHVLARAVQQCFDGLKVVDGYIRGPVRYNHTWLTTESKNIIDVYPVAIVGGPLLLAGDGGPWPLVYLPSREGWWDDEADPADVRRIALILKGIK
jgi:hypothetical protein